MRQTRTSRDGWAGTYRGAHIGGRGRGRATVSSRPQPQEDSSSLQQEKRKKKGPTLAIKKQLREEKIKEEAEEREDLINRCKLIDVPRGTNPLAKNFDLEKYQVNLPTETKFSNLPLSKATLRGLEEAGFTNMKAIQRASIPHGLLGRDILGAAKTGSGKTLAFLIPMVEKLYRLGWGPTDGLGAIIISPSRELALQIFDTLQTFGKYHSFSAGLIVGGKDFKMEQDHIAPINILVATPGRLGQHLQQTSSFDPSNLQMLILDEADRLLDMGFEKQLNSILESLPKSRQTLLFSATQTKSIRDLARLSLVEPEYIGVHEKEAFVTPETLDQSYFIVPLGEKLGSLYHWLKAHQFTKNIVFVATCKEAQYYSEVFRKMSQFTNPIYCIYGRQPQMKRYNIFYEFTQQNSGTLFCTDIASRGLDFPAVNWVVQFDCPDDYQSYIHRVGRTARNDQRGSSVLFLLPSEEAMVGILERNKVPLTKRTPPTRASDITPEIQGALVQDLELKYLAQKAFITYTRSLFLQANKEVFKFDELELDEFSQSLGLVMKPTISFGTSKKVEKNAMRENQARKLLAQEEENGEEGDAEEPEVPSQEQKKIANKSGFTELEKKIRKKKVQDIFTPKFEKLRNKEEEQDEGDLLVPVNSVPQQSAEGKEEKAVGRVSTYKSVSDINLLAEQQKHTQKLQEWQRELEAADHEDKQFSKQVRRERDDERMARFGGRQPIHEEQEEEDIDFDNLDREELETLPDDDDETARQKKRTRAQWRQHQKQVRKERKEQEQEERRAKKKQRTEEIVRNGEAPSEKLQLSRKVNYKTQDDGALMDQAERRALALLSRKGM